MRTALLLVVLLMTGCATGRPADLTPYAGLQINHELVLALQDIQVEFERETILCMLGEVDGRVVRITGFAPARLEGRAPTRVAFLGCDDNNVVGIWHNHPPQDWDACRASHGDVEFLEAHPEFMAMTISCDRGIVFRFRGDPKEHFLPLLTSRIQEEPSP